MGSIDDRIESLEQTQENRKEIGYNVKNMAKVRDSLVNFSFF